MSRKLFFPILVLGMAVLACNLQAPTPATTQTPIIITATFAPATPFPPTQTDIPAATDTAAATSEPAGALTIDMLRNGTYYAPFYGRTVTLVNGSYQESSGGNIFTVTMSTVIAFGDLNGDGKDDAAIILAENSGGSGTFVSVVAVLNQNGAPHQVDQAQLGDRQLVNSVDISSGVIHLDMTVHSPTDPMCCPSVPQKQNFWLIGNKLWLMRLTSTIAGTEHLINVDYPGIWTTVTNPFTVNGSLTVLPFENTLAYHIFKIDGTKVNDSSLIVTPTTGTAGTFSQNFDLSGAGITDWVIIQFVDVSAADGSTIALGSVILKAH
jgi:hypothetical protein